MRLEAAVEGHFAAAETARDEGTVARAQQLAEAGVRRLAELREWEADVQQPADLERG